MIYNHSKIKYVILLYSWMLFCSLLPADITNNNFNERENKILLYDTAYSVLKKDDKEALNNAVQASNKLTKLLIDANKYSDSAMYLSGNIDDLKQILEAHFLWDNFLIR